MAVPVWHNADQVAFLGTTASTSFVAQKPDNLQANDLWWVMIGLSRRTPGSAVLALPDNWNTAISAGTFSSVPVSASFFKPITNPETEPPNVTFSLQGGNETKYHILSGRISGADLANPVVASSIRQNLVNPPAVIDVPGVNTPVADCLMLGHFVWRSTSIGQTMDGLPPEMTTLAFAPGPGASDEGRYGAAREDRPTAGPTGNRVATLSASVGGVAGHLVAIAPADNGNGNGEPPPPLPDTRPALFFRRIIGDSEMSAIVPRNTPNSTLRAIPFMWVQDDGITPANVTVTGIKPLFRRAGTGGGFDPLSGDIVAVNGSAGVYEVRLTQAESDHPNGNYQIMIPATGAGIQTPIMFQIGPPDTFEDPVTPEEFASVSVQAFDNQSEKLDIPISAVLFPEITDEGLKTIVFRDRNGNIVAQGTFARDSVFRHPFTEIDPGT